jgi:hypothetical protein
MMPKGDGYWYDETKLPRWAQEKIADLRNKLASAEVLAAKGAGASWANADIFSAVPELLEACKNLLWHFAPSSRLGHATMRTDELRDYAEAAIAKAEGSR